MNRAVLVGNLICIAVYTPMFIKNAKDYIWCWMTGSVQIPLHDVIMPAICVATNVTCLIMLLEGIIT